MQAADTLLSEGLIFRPASASARGDTAEIIVAMTAYLAPKRPASEGRRQGAFVLASHHHRNSRRTALRQFWLSRGGVVDYVSLAEILN